MRLNMVLLTLHICSDPRVFLKLSKRRAIFRFFFKAFLNEIAELKAS